MSDVFELIAENDVEGLKQWLDKGGNPSDSTLGQFQPIMIALKIGSIEVLELFLKSRLSEEEYNDLTNTTSYVDFRKPEVVPSDKIRSNAINAGWNITTGEE
jgi:hypothetical protein